MISLALLQWFDPIAKGWDAGESIRESGMWYPTLLPPYFLLHEPKIIPTGFSPLTWISFGGHQGSLLSNLSGVTFYCSYILHGIEFHYTSSDDSQIPNCKFGDCKLRQAGFTKTNEIDGPGGERITAISISAPSSTQNITTTIQVRQVPNMVKADRTWNISDVIDNHELRQEFWFTSTRTARDVKVFDYRSRNYSNGLLWYCGKFLPFKAG
jgi:hypothetical protein